MIPDRITDCSIVRNKGFGPMILQEKESEKLLPKFDNWQFYDGVPEEDNWAIFEYI